MAIRNAILLAESPQTSHIAGLQPQKALARSLQSAMHLDVDLTRNKQ